ncbi:hypothetical protein BN2475_680008 [Paraburkholderia ribeironis]|uniref:Uncharacterized protein n=1 Tax=Paraburkholderia ribeironis TaxID=1247936 RepID=A0A1N7SH18_9BURK|nr:hypothetical protein BN2475_680008 [Paraburkholderia ribeironis]
MPEFADEVRVQFVTRKRALFELPGYLVGHDRLCLVCRTTGQQGEGNQQRSAHWGIHGSRCRPPGRLQTPMLRNRL